MMEEQKLAFVCRSLTMLSLQLPSSGVHYTHPLPQFLIHPEGCTTALVSMLKGLSGPCRIDGGEGTFEFHGLAAVNRIADRTYIPLSRWNVPTKGVDLPI